MKKYRLLFLKTILLCLFAFSSFAQDSPKAIREAAELMARGDVKGAIAVLDKAIEKRKELFEAYRMRANLQMFSGNVVGAVADLDKAIEIKQEAAVYAERANFKVFLRDSEGALKDYDSAIANGYKTDKAYGGRAMLKRNTGDLDGAIADYQTAVGLNTNSAQAHVGLASTLDQMGKTAGAIEILQGFLDRYEQKRNGSLPQSKMNPTIRGVIIKDEKSDKDVSQVFLQGMGTTMDINAETKEDAEKQVSVQERILNLALAYANLAQMLERTGEFDKALMNVEKSISIFRSDPYAIGLRGKILADKGDLTRAMTDLNAAIRSMPTVPEHYADRGLVYLRLGKEAEAQKDFDKFLQLAPRAAEFLNRRIEEAKRKIQESPEPQK